MLRSAARDLGLTIVGGSVPEAGSDGALYNTSLTFAVDGSIIAKHRKVHLFDIDCSASGGIKFTESDTLTAGSALTTFSVPDSGLCAGVGICYDIRFPEMSAALSRRGVDLLIFPGAFNMTTGPAHWELLARARALDNQVWVAVCSPARVEGGEGYVPWGHSCVVDPWGSVVGGVDEGEGIVWADVGKDRVEEVRGMIPVRGQKREDVYCEGER